MTIPIFPALPGLAFPVKRTPTWSTLKQDSWSGKSSPIKIWSYPRRQFTLVFELLRSKNGWAELQQLEGFFNSVGGSAGIFAFVDIDDEQTTNASFGAGDGVTTTFQLCRSWGGFVEPVFYPVGSMTVYVNGAATTGFAIGTNPGQIVFQQPPVNNAALTWTGSYAWLCRFDDDSYDFSKFMDGMFELGSISFTTVKL